MADTKTETAARQASGRVARQLDRDADALGCGWWETETAGVITDLAHAGPFTLVLAALAQAINETRDPLWVIGKTTVDAAQRVAWEWLKTGIDPTTVLGWLRAGCWDPDAARRLTDAGIDPDRLLDDDGRPIDRIETSTGELVPLAQAVSDQEITAETAAHIATNR
jgi:hypothetical protein